MQILIALILVLALIGILAIFLQKIRKVNLWRITKEQKLHVKEVLNIDIKKKLLIVDYNNKSYVLLLGNNDIVVDIIESAAEETEKEVKQISPTLY
ncbi:MULTISPECIES: hypothetical protein [unclassified Candidatus Lariskella]|uniref:hypothetical protein n=1 Tax=unclassified Candidatus Lariskella TaxID=2632605 RepID=UPI0030CC8978